ncbi:MAG: histidinol-phosphatase HisJ family protein [Clostridiales bacterium]|nr:histidinol-phosphatase HisJ family protein [Clostridiales bacterium]
MVLTDLHTHSTFSTDGKSSLLDMVQSAKARGLRYYGISEHFDLDDYSIKLYSLIDERNYFSQARQLQQQFNDDNFTFLAGCEFNYVSDRNVWNKFCAVMERSKPDYVVNSVHIVDGQECFRREYFDGKSQQYAFSRYLEQVLESLDVPYHYDVVGHLGYVARNAPYETRKVAYEDFHELYDTILNKIIQKDVILEVNSSARGAACEFLPDVDVLRRYYELGGRKISFGSDAHWTDRIADKRQLVCDSLTYIGFTHITVPCKGKHIKVQLPVKTDN